MLTLRKKHQVPPGGYVYHDPEMDMDFSANTLAQLVEKVALIRRANNLTIPENFKSVIEDWICQRLPKSFVIGDPDPVKQRQFMPLSVVRTATELFMTGWRLNGSKLCTPEEADRRADICIQCEANTTNAACLGCKGLLSWIRTKNQRKTLKDSLLLVCNRCAVMNVAAIHCDEGYIKRSTAPDVLAALPTECWKKAICEGAK